MDVKFLDGMLMSNNQILENDDVKYIPELRFSEFAEPWVSCDLCTVTEKPLYGMNAAAKEFDGENKYLRITDINEETRLFDTSKLTSPDGELDDKYLLTQGDLLFTRTGASVGKTYLYKENDGKVFFAGFLIKFKLKPCVIPEFIFYQTLTSSYSTWVKKTSVRSGQPGINAEEYSGLKVMNTSRKEQQKIVNCLLQLDKLIQTELNKLDKLQDHKTGLLQNLFPNSGENLPRLRLSEFDQKWENIELSQIAKPVKKKNSTGNEIKVLSLSNEHGLVSQADYFLKKVAGDNTDRYIVLQKNDFVYNDRITKNSTFGTIKRLSLYESGIVSPIYKCFRFEKNQNPIFWEYFFESKVHESEIKQIVNEGARAGRYNISIDKFLSINVMQPSSTEQEKIASCLTSLDRLISNQTNYIEELKKHKIGLMQQLFPVVEEI